jgi:hypothetical protein
VQSGAIGCNKGSQLGAEHLPIRCNQVQSDAIRTASLHGLPGWHQDAKLGPVCVGHVLNAFTRILKDKSVFAAYPRIRTPACVYAPPAYTHPCLRIRTYPRIRTLGCVYARTCVYAPTPAYKHVCVNAASGAYTHLPAYTHPTLRLRGDATNVMLKRSLRGAMRGKRGSRVRGRGCGPRARLS